MNANGDNAEIQSQLDCNKNPRELDMKSENVMLTHYADNLSKKPNLEKAMAVHTCRCSPNKNSSVSSLRQVHAAESVLTTTYQGGFIGDDSGEGIQAGSHTPLTYGERGLYDEDCDNLIFDGVIPIELKEDDALSEDEAVPCELCSPRFQSVDPCVNRGQGYLPPDYRYGMNGALTLDQLDDDALFHIASFLESRTIRFALSLVSHRFYYLFSRGAYYWKTRYTAQIGAKCRCPTVRTPAKFHVSDKCLEWDDSQRIWKNPDSNTQHFDYSHNILVGADALHIMNRGQIVLSGDRNRTLNLIDLKRYPGPEASMDDMQSMLVHSDKMSHDGWIWTIYSVDNMILTGSWDTRIRVFDADAQCRLATEYKCTSAILSLYAEENEIFAGCFDKKIYCIDRRSPNMKFRVSHAKTVLSVTGNEKFIISGSEDRRISIYDRIAGKIYKVFKLENYPLCISYRDDQLWSGDRSGTLHLHDGTGGVFRYIGSYDVGHTQKMNGVINTPGAVFTCSSDGTVKVLEPTRNPCLLTTLKSHRKEVADVAYSHGVLASAGDDCVSLWLPKHWDRNTYLL